MRAIVMDHYGSPDVLNLEQIDRPEPGPGEVLVRTRASSVNPYDWHLLTGEPKLFRPAFGGLRRPKNPVLGADLSGTVEEIGEGVTGFAPGDEVYGQIPSGAFADFAVADAGILAPKPAGLSHEEAAVIPLAGLTALQGLRDHGGVADGDRVVVNGASGGVGTLTVQIAAHLGCEVTAVCSGRNADLVRALGADHVVDYTTDDFTAEAGRYDLILDLVGNRSLRDLRRALAEGGTYLASHGQPEHRWLGPIFFLARMALTKLFTREQLKVYVARLSSDDLRILGDLAAAGTIRPVIDRSFPLEQVADAFRHLETWRTRGKIAITI